MTLIDKEDQIKIIEELKSLGKVPKKSMWSSATNSIVAASLFGSSCYMACIANNDDSGQFYLETSQIMELILFRNFMIHIYLQVNA